MSDTNCIDWQITEKLLEQLKTCTAENDYNTDIKTVSLLRSEIDFKEEYPMLIVCPNEIDPDQEYLRRDDILPFALLYSDGQQETSDSYIKRYRNVAADIIKCLKANPSLDSLCQNVSIPNYGYTVIYEMKEAICYLFVEIERTIDASDPYKLA